MAARPARERPPPGGSRSGPQPRPRHARPRARPRRPRCHGSSDGARPLTVPPFLVTVPWATPRGVRGSREDMTGRSGPGAGCTSVRERSREKGGRKRPSFGPLAIATLDSVGYTPAHTHRRSSVPTLSVRAEVAMTRPRSLRSLTLLVAALLLLPAGPGWAQTPKYGGVLVTHPLSATPSLSPHEESTVATVQQASPCFNNLVYYDPAKKLESVDTIIPELAERWSWQDGQRTLVFSLRHDVKWHDGKPFTSADVKYTFD